MSSTLIAAVGFVYLLTAASLFIEGKAGLAIAFIGYAIGNLGLYLAAR